MVIEEHFIGTSLDTELVEELLPQFLSEMSSDFKNLLESFNRNNHTVVREVAHRMRGTAKVFGAFRIEKLAETVELRVVTEGQPFLLESIEELRTNIKIINQEFKDRAA